MGIFWKPLYWCIINIQETTRISNAQFEKFWHTAHPCETITTRTVKMPSRPRVSLCPSLLTASFPSRNHSRSTLCHDKLVVSSRLFWSGSIQYVLLLSEFARQNYVPVHPFCCACQQLIPCYCWAARHGLGIPQFVWEFTCWWTLGCVQFWAVPYQAAVKRCFNSGHLAASPDDPMCPEFFRC